MHVKTSHSGSNKIYNINVHATKITVMLEETKVVYFKSNQLLMNVFHFFCKLPTELDNIYTNFYKVIIYYKSSQRHFLNWYCKGNKERYFLYPWRSNFKYNRKYFVLRKLLQLDKLERTEKKFQPECYFHSISASQF